MIPADSGAAKAARDAVVELSERLNPRALEDVRLLVSELVTNSVRHAGLDAAAAIRVRVEFKPRFVRVEVVDPGMGFRPLAPSPDERPGWGLFLVQKIADRWGVQRSEKTSVWFELDGAESAPGLPRP
jgi:anti-sigma regulatory factor (Ser/Thr protein kinase)